MKKLLLALALCLLPSLAFAQCNGIFAANTVCGRIGTQGTPGQIPLGASASLVATPEQFGAKGDGSTDDSVAFTNLCTAINLGTIKWVSLRPNATYNIWNTAPTTQSVLCLLGVNANGLRWDFNGAQLNVAYTGTSVTYVFELVGISGIAINDLQGTAATGKHVSGDTTGVNWVTCSNQGGGGFGCKQVDIARMNVNGGLNGVAITRAAGTGTSSQNIHITGYFANVGYPVSNQFDGLNTSFDIVTNNPGRSYIGYNTAGVKGRVNATNEPSLNDIEIAAYGFQGDLSNNTTTNIEIEYINRVSTLYGSSQLAISHQQADPVHASIATTISNISFHVDIVYNGTPSTELLEENSNTGLGSSQSPGDIAGNTDDNIVINGKVEGEINATYLGCIQTVTNGNCIGFSGLSTGTYFLSNLQIPTSAKPWAIGTGVTDTFGPNYAQPNAAAPTYDAGANIQLSNYVQPVVFSGTPGSSFNGALNIFDPNSTGSPPSSGARFRKGNAAQFFSSADAEIGVLTANGGSFFMTTVAAQPICFGFNNLGTPAICLSSATELQPNTDNVFALGDASHRYSNTFSTIGTHTNLVLSGPAAHSILLGQGASNVTGVAPVAAGRILTDNGAGADPTFQSSVDFWVGNAQNLVQNTQNFCGTSVCSGGGTSTSFPIQRAGTFKNLVVYSNTAPAAGQTYTATIYEGGLLAVTCTISNPATQCNDTTHTAAHTAGNGFFFRIDLSATAGNNSFAYGVELDGP